MNNININNNINNNNEISSMLSSLIEKKTHSNNNNTNTNNVPNKKNKVKFIKTKKYYNINNRNNTIRNNTIRNNTIRNNNNNNSNNSNNKNKTIYDINNVNDELEANYTNDLETKYNDTTNTINTITTELNNSNTMNTMKMKMSPEEFKTLIEKIQDYLQLDKTYLVKHNELKKLYTTYNNSYTNNTKNNINNTINETQHKEILKNIHSEMNDNNSNLFNGRLIILKKIKDEPKIEPVIKNKLCGHLLAIFKRPPNSEYQQLPMLSQSNEKIAIDELDSAYLQKHNELMIVYKAYQKLFNKVLNYKSELEQYKKLPTRSSISRNHMNKLVSDQSFVMNMIDKMQDQLIDNKVMDNSDKIPVHPVTSHPKNIDTFNDTMKKQITTIVDSQSPVKPKLRTSIDKVLTKYRDCTESNALCCKSDYEKQKKCLDGTCKR